MPVTTVESPTATSCIALEPIWNLSLPTATISKQKTLRVGSSQEMDFVAALDGVADFHCEFEICHRGRVIVRPQQDQSVWINDDPVIGEDLVRVGDRIAVGPAIFRVISEETSLSTGALLNQIAHLQVAPAKTAEPSVDEEAGRRHSQALRAQEEDLRRQTQMFQQQQRSLLERQSQFDDWVQQAEQRLRDSEQRLMEDREQTARRESSVAEERREAARQLSEAEARSESLRLEQEKAEARAESLKLEQQKLETLADQLATETAELQQERARFEAGIQEQTEEINRLKADAEKQAEAKAEDSAELRDECDRLQDKIDVLEMNLAKSRAAAAEWKTAEANSFQETIDRQQYEISQLEARLAAHNAFSQSQNATEDSDAERRQLEDSIAELREALQQSEVAAETERGQLEYQIGDLQTQLESHLDELLQTEASLREIESVKENEKQLLEDQLVDLQEQIEQQRGEFGRVEESFQASLRQRESELIERTATLQQKDAELRQLEDKLASVSAVASNELDEERQAEREKLSAAVQESETLRAENEEYAIALQELKQAFEAARDELSSRQLIERAEPQTSPDEGSKVQLEELRAELDAAEAKLATSLAERETRDAELETLRDQLERLSVAFQAQQQELESRIVETAARDTRDDEVQDQEEKWQQEIQRLTEELEAARKATDDVRETLTAELEEHRSTIARLAAELEMARAELDTALKPENSDAEADDSNHEEAAALIEELTERLQEQQQIIERLTASAGSADANEHSVMELEEVRTLHRELDDRTVRLDSREQDLGERQRVVENEEAELENQRRELLEARQQLELARAEIGSAIDPVDQQETIPAEPAEGQQDADVEVRSEFAELFGIDAATIPADSDEAPEAILEAPSIQLKPPVSVAESDLPAVDDYSQEASAAVSISFGNEASLLSANEDAANHADTGDDEHSDADAAVADYMEQLLARTRGRAGENVVEELKPATPPKAKTEPKAPEKPPETKEEQQPAQQKSFIDAYMAGEYSEDGESSTGAADLAAPETAAAAARVEVRSQPRTKIDLNALRSNMDSFRELSTKSVESALETHAREQERGGIQATKGLFFAFLLMSVFVLGASIVDVIPFGLITVGVFAPTVITGLYLAYKSTQIRERVRKANAALKSGELQADFAGNLQSANPIGPEAPVVPKPAATMTDSAKPKPTETPDAATGPDAATQPDAAPEALDVEDLVEDSPEPAVSESAVADFEEPTPTELPSLELPPSVAELLPQIEADSTAPPAKRS